MKIALISVGTFLLTWGLVTIGHDLLRQQKQSEALTKFVLEQAFERGFWAGSRATISNITVTDGKPAVELTNLFNALEQEKAK